MKQGLILVCCLVGIQSCSGRQAAPKDCPLGACDNENSQLCVGQRIATCTEGCYVVTSDCAPGTCNLNLGIGRRGIGVCNPAIPATVHFTVHGLTGQATVSLYSALMSNLSTNLGDVATLTVAADGAYDLTSKYNEEFALAVTTQPAGQFCTVAGLSTTADIECFGTATPCDTFGDECFVDPECPDVQQPDGGSTPLFSRSSFSCDRADAGADGGQPICCHGVTVDLPSARP
jgi:hypothetical protein